MSDRDLQYVLIGDKWINTADPRLQGLFAAHDALRDRGYPIDETQDICNQIDERFRELKEASTLRRTPARNAFGTSVLFAGLPALYGELPFGRAIHIENNDMRWIASNDRLDAVMLKGVLRCQMCHRTIEFSVPHGGITLVFPAVIFGAIVSIGQPVEDSTRAMAQQVQTTATDAECWRKATMIAENLFTGKPILRY